MNTNEKIIDIIINRRKALKLSLSETARRMGIPKSTLSRYESLERQFPLNQISNIASVLGITADEILGLEEPEDISSSEQTLIKAFNELSIRQQEQLLKLVKYDLHDEIFSTVELMSKADDKFRDKVASYAKFEYFEYEKNLEQKNKGKQNTAG
ncbi:helix-turn-helix domain-containing protein [Lactococcus lactis]|uniref:helix-turn-helix domain-containing protein n=1 Tax=Lactococcus lactis TaxID=1358 RepID=UPI001913610B|nr:helix-turn-helix transcriptional regulator [Lactococcus lactis]WDA67655.1 helix-turn-helix transcriptional regulator [Lactococcus lactis]